MLLKENFTEQHIRELQQASKRDPVLIERAVYAFGLLEALTQVGLPFIFKGGTCLMLLMDKPGRLSTDIDILVSPGTDIDEYINNASKIFPFLQVEEQKRIGKNQIEKRHFKFTYDSPINGRIFYILLDVLFEKNHYSELTEREIQSNLLLTEPEYMKVQIPSPNCLLADKLTAFAPHTTGILLNTGKDMEIMKQLYDIMTLTEVLTDIKTVSSTYKSISRAEAGYRGLDATLDDCLWDSFYAALCIASRGKSNSEEYGMYVKGIRDLRGHIFSKNYSAEIAAMRSVKVMYLILCLICGQSFESVGDYSELINQPLLDKRLSSLRYLKKVDLEAYAYAVKTDQLLVNLEEPI